MNHGCVSLTQKCTVLYGCAQAMQYLNSMNIMHRDLNALNVSLTDELYPKVSCFSCSKVFKDSMEHSLYSTSVLSTAPEMMLGDRHYTFKVDVS